MILRSSCFVVVTVVVSVVVFGCAKAELDACAPDVCSRSCVPRVGACIDGSCMCTSPDGGCSDPTCSDQCRRDGHTGGYCLGGTCQCSGTAADGDADGDMPEARDDAGIDDVGADEAAADEATPLDPGDPCTVDDLVEQEICGPGMKCTFTELVGSRPDPICDREGARELNVPCGGTVLSDTCAAGLLCIGAGGGNRCRRMCRTDADCLSSGPNSGCLIQLNSGGTIVDGVKFCTLHCDVLLATGCETGQACRPTIREDPPGSGAYDYYTDCTGVGSGTQGSDCSALGAAACAARYQCFTFGAADQRCLYICETSRFGGDCPAPARTCSDMHDPTGRLGACQ